MLDAAVCVKPICIYVDSEAGYKHRNSRRFFMWQSNLLATPKIYMLHVWIGGWNWWCRVGPGRVAVGWGCGLGR